MKRPQLTILFCMTAAAAAAQAVSDGPAFEVASMKIAAPYDKIGYQDKRGPATISPGLGLPRCLAVTTFLYAASRSVYPKSAPLNNNGSRCALASA
jgi:hypothetical protein